MKIQHIKVSHEDDRGSISDILQHINVDSVTLITIKEGAIRGNHFHKKSVQYSYVLSGQVIAFIQINNQRVEKAVLNKGDMLESPVMEKHALHGVEANSTLLILTLGPRGGNQYEDDTFRTPPLHESYSK